MILNKRISKLRKAMMTYPQDGSDGIDSTSPCEKSQKVTRCRFKQIPQNTKFTITDPMYPLLGDIPLRDSQHGLSMDISLYNHFKLYRQVVVTDFSEQKIIMVRPSQKNDKILKAQVAVVDRLEAIQSFDKEEWVRIIRTFYQKYDKVMKRQTRKKTKCDVRKKFYVKITAKTMEKKKELYEKYPCFELQFRIRNHQSQLSEIIFSDQFIRELGYSDESFISTVLNEGIPQIAASDTPFSSDIKQIIDNYFRIDNDGFESQENQITLMLKCGYVKDVKYQMYVLMNYENNTFGMDVIMAIVAKGEPYLPIQEKLIDKMNESFVREMITRENEAEYLLSTYYNEVVQRKYTDMDKRCHIREIPSQE